MIRNEALLATLKGPPISVLLCFMFYGNAALRPSFIARKTGYSREAVYKALWFLHDHGYTQRLESPAGWVATRQVHQQMLPLMGTVNLVDKSVNLVDSPSSSSSIDSGSSGLLLQTTPPESVNLVDSCEDLVEPPRNQLVAELLQASGVFKAQAQELAEDEWVTVERVEAWVRRLKKDRSVRSLGAVLYTNLRHHLEAGPAGAKSSWADYVCPRCSMRPCHCEEFGIRRGGSDKND